jgi:hypothetical protein
MANQIEQNRRQAGQALMGGGQSALTQGLAGTQAGLAASQVPMTAIQNYQQSLAGIAPALRGQFQGTGGYTQVNQGSTGNTTVGMSGQNAALGLIGLGSLFGL